MCNNLSKTSIIYEIVPPESIPKKGKSDFRGNGSKWGRKIPEGQPTR